MQVWEAGKFHPTFLYGGGQVISLIRLSWNQPSKATEDAGSWENRFQKCFVLTWPSESLLDKFWLETQ